ncbi:MAG TPA: hypothetical protein VM537_19290 [Anaerolineae bacterium]|nr:hypothetical protein [Anaerolineae bacterium]
MAYGSVYAVLRLLYAVVDGEPTQAQWDAAMDTPGTVRKSIDETKYLLRWDAADGVPSVYLGLPVYGPCEVQIILSGPEWAA